MAFVENIPPVNGESEMEEGEIVDDFDELSDISSEEEFLLRQRLQVLENYNNVLERKKAKNSFFRPGKREEDTLLHDLSEISATDLEDSFIVVRRPIKVQKPLKPHFKQKKKKNVVPRHIEAQSLGKVKDHKKKAQRKKRLEVKVVSESSEESEDEYRNKRRKLADAVTLNRDKNDKSSLQDRIQKMLGIKSKKYKGSGSKIKENSIFPLTPPLATKICVYKDKNTKIENSSKTDNTDCLRIPSLAPSINATENKQIKVQTDDKMQDVSHLQESRTEMPILTIDVEEVSSAEMDEEQKSDYELIDLCTDDDTSRTKLDHLSTDTVDSVIKDKTDSENKRIPEEDLDEEAAILEEDLDEEAPILEEDLDEVATEKKGDTESKPVREGDSDEDLEQLRQHALKSKACKTKIEQPPVQEESEKPVVMSEDEDSDTAELRLICLKSALLKKAIEMKQKQRLKKRLSQSSNLQDDFLVEYDKLQRRVESENNTDIESVDMDIGSDAEVKDYSNENTGVEATDHNKVGESDKLEKHIQKPKEDELEEDEDLLRAQLLTSLSKNLPNLVDPSLIDNIEENKQNENIPPVPKIKIPENRIVINLGESDSEGEHEATRNLTKMHMKLSEQIDFQHKLDMFLKSTRMEVENKELPDVVQKSVPKTTEKYVAKTVNHLPKSEQIEYKNLVKRMAELEKIKEARQTSMSLANQPLVKETLKPRNIVIDTTKVVSVNNLEEQVALSRKKIAEESAKMMKLREEATKLTQKYKIVATELKNISTAITLNKKEQRAVQNKLSKIRLQHQRLLNSSQIRHSKEYGNLLTEHDFMSILQKENNPMKDDYRNPQMLQSVKVSVVNDQSEELVVPQPLQVQVDATSNKKIVKVCKDKAIGNIDPAVNTKNVKEIDASLPVVETNRTDELINRIENRIERRKTSDDYESPLQALDSANWEGDPNAILCPFEVGGNCKDPDCKYLHPKVPSQ